ncbi:MAG TPA: RNA methyltransferase [Bryobacteraceae bacterium]|nr:RNA methyltransferase [Bryobacteraceae bacterium]
MGTVTSAKNPLLKEVRKAVRASSLTESGLCIAEGFHLLKEALRSGCHIEEVLVSEPVREALRERVPGLDEIPVVPLHERLFSTVASTEATQGVLALVRPPSWTMDDVFRGETLTVIVDGVQDPGNAGAILRAAEAFGASGAVFLKGAASPWNPKALRASAGSAFRLPLVTSADAAETLDLARRNQARLYAGTPHDGRSIAECDFTERCAIVIGSEGRGVNPELAESCELLRIPTTAVESLNAGMSAAVMLYEARRQRSTQGGAAQ